MSPRASSQLLCSVQTQTSVSLAAVSSARVRSTISFCGCALLLLAPVAAAPSRMRLPKFRSMGTEGMALLFLLSDSLRLVFRFTIYYLVKLLIVVSRRFEWKYRDSNRDGISKMFISQCLYNFKLETFELCCILILNFCNVKMSSEFLSCNYFVWFCSYEELYVRNWTKKILE